MSLSCPRRALSRPIRRRKCGYILTTDQSDAGSAGIFLRRTNQTQEVRVYSHDGPIGHWKPCDRARARAVMQMLRACRTELAERSI
eukprot:238320-Prorocentrum_minimum.AAC.1